MKKSVRIDIIIEKSSEKQIRIPQGMTVSAGLIHYPFFMCSSTRKDFSMPEKIAEKGCIR